MCGRAGHVGEVRAEDLYRTDHGKRSSAPAEPRGIVAEQDAIDALCNTAGILDPIHNRERPPPADIVAAMATRDHIRPLAQPPSLRSTDAVS